ncbi:hypothetical protein UFOVP181_206 [uncultured Caudovirales phage]|uniref:Uncharacterized protein n=1 Tax=uncultured Caudovirales phage TaxID=2100421 RepID=A0A6J7WGY3_9CAUD|nr:hypothetical protein UFOVP57_433 [uncultured Caudovirales phage]CAB5208834.1 hypothetical protein UFOVP181_206 [uncultured Caudovirales phage]
MKKVLLTLLAFSQLAIAQECKVQQATQNVSRQNVSGVINLVKNKQEGSCQVIFKITVDGQTHLVDHTYKGLYQPEILCQMSIEEGRGMLLTEIGGTFESESVTVCKEGANLKFRPLKIGDEILEGEAPVIQGKPYFKYRNTQCRLFRERYNQNGNLRVNHGVICQTDNSLWTVVDKW